MKFEFECEREEGGRWLAEVSELPGALPCGATADEAMAKAEAFALRVPAASLEPGEARPVSISISVPPPARANGRRQRPNAFLPRSTAMVGNSSGSLGHVEHSPKTVGRTSCLRSTTAKKQHPRHASPTP